jgi:hypothetical protein
MNSKYLYFTLLGIICLLIIGLAGGAYGAAQLLTSQSKQLVDNREQVKVLAQDQDELNTARRDIQKYQDLAAVAKSVVPEDKDQAQTVGQIVAIANANGVSLGSITFPNSSLGLGAGSNLSQLLPVKGVAGVYNLQLTVASGTNNSVDYPKFISFLDALEHNRRTAEVTGINIQPDSNNHGKVSFSLVLEEYIKP